MIDSLRPIKGPCNIVKRLDCDFDYITVGGTTEHTFIVPINIEESVKALDIYYKYGLDVVLDKTLNDITYYVDEDKNTTAIKCVLSPSDTSLFKDWYRDATVQLKITLIDEDSDEEDDKEGSVLYSDIYYLKVLKSLK